MDINEIAMNVIMDACSGRDKVDEAFSLMSSQEYDLAEKCLEEAKKMITKSHIAQTQVIQSQAAGENMEYSILFIHAQDTLMTSMSELRIAQQMHKILKNQSEYIEKLRKKVDINDK